MKIVRVSAGRKTKYGVLEGDIIYGLKGDPFLKPLKRDFATDPDGSKYNINEVKLLAPCCPSKIVGQGLNYRSHIEEIKFPMPTRPHIFLKPPTAVIGPDDKIVLPDLSRKVEFEGELGVVIGRKAKNVPEDQAKEYVIGYTCFNDVSDRDSQNEDGQWTRGKGHDTFAPIGPCIETEVEPDDLKLETYLNGELRQSSRTSDLLFGVPRLISFISSVMTLLPGDVIATGTPSGTGRIRPGDVVEVKIEKIGTLRNYVIGIE